MENLIEANKQDLLQEEAHFEDSTPLDGKSNLDPVQDISIGEIMDSLPSRPVQAPIPQATVQDILGTQLPPATPTSEEQDSKEEKDNWDCPLCKKPFVYRSHLTRHLERIHVVEAPVIIAGLPQTRRKKGFANTGTTKPITDVPNFEDINKNKPAIEVISVDFRTLATMMFDMTTGAAAMTLGPEWNPENEQQKEFVVGPLEAYLRSKEVKDIPPGVMLCFAIAAYSAPRLQAPSTLGKLKLGWQWVKNKFSRKK